MITLEQFKLFVQETFPDNQTRVILESDLRDGLISLADLVIQTTEQVYEQFALASGLGTFDASTGKAMIRETGEEITLTSVSIFPNGKYFDVVNPGITIITGESVSALERGVIISRGEKYDYLPPIGLDVQYTSETTYGAQLFDKSTILANLAPVTPGYLQDWTVSSGGLITAATSSAGGRTMKVILHDPTKTFLKATGLENLTVSGKRWAFTDASNVTLTFGNIGTEAQSIISIPAGAAFFYLTYKHPTLDSTAAGDALMINYGSVALAYQAYTPPAVLKKLVTVNGAKVEPVKLTAGATMESAGASSASLVNRQALEAALGGYVNNGALAAAVSAVIELIPAVTVENTSAYGVQLFDKSTILTVLTQVANGYYQDYTVSSSGVVSSAPTAVGGRMLKAILYDPSQTSLKVSGLQNLGSTTKRWCFKNSAEVLLTYGNISGEGTSTIAIPAGAAFFYLTFKHPTGDTNTAGDALMVNYGVLSLPYQAYTVPVVTQRISKINNIPIGTTTAAALLEYAKRSFVTAFNFLFGRKLVSLGDSITAQQMWQPLLASLKGLVYSSDETVLGLSGHAKMGVGGSTIVPVIKSNGSGGYITGQGPGESIFMRAADVHFYAPELIILMGGQNDGRLGAYNLADIPYTGTEFLETAPVQPSFVSCYKGILVRLITDNPAAKVVAMSPMYTGAVALSDADLASYKLRNDTIRSICAMYSVQFIDLLNEVGITALNNGTYTIDGIHPNQLGGQKIAQLLAGKL